MDELEMTPEETQLLMKLLFNSSDDEAAVLHDKIAGMFDVSRLRADKALTLVDMTKI